MATLVKLLRGAMLLPVILLAAAITRARCGESGTGERPPQLPSFALGGEASRWCLVIAMAANGMKTQLRELVTVGLKPVALMLGETVLLAALALGLLRLL